MSSGSWFHMPFRSRQDRRPGWRVFGLLAVAAFLMVQPWVLCPITCFSHGMVDMPMPHTEHHRMECHHGPELRRDLASTPATDVMLPTVSVAIAHAPATVRPEFPAPTTRGVQQVPASEPPPPRLS